MTATLHKPRARAARAQARPETEPSHGENTDRADRVVQMARRSVELVKLAEASDLALSLAKDDYPEHLRYKELSSLRYGELEAVESFISYAQCTSPEGAIAQLMLAYNWVGQCQGDDDHREDFERIERLTQSALFYLANALKIDLSQLGGDYYIGERGREIVAEREVCNG